MVSRHHWVPKAKQWHDEAILGAMDVDHVIPSQRKGVEGREKLQDRRTSVLGGQGRQCDDRHTSIATALRDPSASIDGHFVALGVPHGHGLHHALSAAS